MQIDRLGICFRLMDNELHWIRKHLRTNADDEIGAYQTGCCEKGIKWHKQQIRGRAKKHSMDVDAWSAEVDKHARYIAISRRSHDRSNI